MGYVERHVLAATPALLRKEGKCSVVTKQRLYVSWKEDDLHSVCEANISCEIVHMSIGKFAL